MSEETIAARMMDMAMINPVLLYWARSELLL
jgi:hypothetical protein